MIISVLGLVAALSPALAGGRLRGYAQVRLRHGAVVLLALVAQVVAIEVVPGASHSLLSAVHLATYVAAGWFVWVNRRVPGLGVIALGATANGIAIALNGGTLPASESALARAGIHLTPGEFLNSGVLENPRLGFLGDVFAVPASTSPTLNTLASAPHLRLTGRPDLAPGCRDRPPRAACGRDGCARSTTHMTGAG